MPSGTFSPSLLTNRAVRLEERLLKMIRDLVEFRDSLSGSDGFPVPCGAVR
jgi:hypothetical protein